MRRSNEATDFATEALSPSAEELKAIKYVNDLINDINALNIKEIHNEMENWLISTELYLRDCLRRGKLPDMGTVRSYYANAFYCGLLQGTMLPSHEKDKHVFSVRRMRVDDAFMLRLLEGITDRKSKCPANVHLIFPRSLCTDNTLEALASAITSDNFPDNVVIDISDLPQPHAADQEHRPTVRFTEKGYAALLKALQSDKCNKSVIVKVEAPRGFISEDLLTAINEQQKENHEHFKPKAKEEKPSLLSRLRRGGAAAAAAPAKAPKKSKSQEKVAKKKPEKKASKPSKAGLHSRSKSKAESEDKKPKRSSSPQRK